MFLRKCYYIIFNLTAGGSSQADWFVLILYMGAQAYEHVENFPDTGFDAILFHIKMQIQVSKVINYFFLRSLILLGNLISEQKSPAFHTLLAHSFL